MTRPAPFAALSLLIAAACGHPDDSDLKVINGKTVAEDAHPAVYSIGGCTATFVSDSTMITAGHCISPGGSVTLYNRSGARSQRIIRHPNYQGVGLYDTAIVLFPPGTSSHWLPIQKQAVAAYDDVLLVGYGCTLSSGRAGVKRIGTNKIASTQGGVIHLQRNTTGPESGESATLCPGDSGGPLLKDGTLVGIASYWDGGAGRVSGHADVTHRANQEFLSATLTQGAKINFADGPNEPNTGGSALGDSLFMALREGSSDQLEAIGSAPAGIASMRLCPVATGDTCEATTDGAIVSRNARTKGDRSLHDFGEALSAADQLRFVLVALDANGKVLHKRILKLEKA